MRRTTEVLRDYREQWQAQRATGKNLFDKSKSPINGIRTESIVTVWGSAVLNNKETLAILKPSVNYTISYDVECIRIPEHTSVYSNTIGLLFYSGKNATTYPAINLNGGEYLAEGKRKHFIRKFVAPNTIDDPEANYRLLCYTNRYLDDDGKGVMSDMIFRNIQIEEGDTATDYEPYCGGTPYALTVNNCKGGMLSTLDEYGLVVKGRTLQDGVPSPDNPVEIQCVKQGTVIQVKDADGNVTGTATCPCDLYEGDSWWPVTGRVVKNNAVKVLDGSEAYSEYRTSDAPPHVYHTTFLGVKKQFYSSKSDKFVNKDSAWSTRKLYTYSDHHSNEFKYFVSPLSIVGDWKAWLAENPVTVVYELAEPVTEQYDPQPLRAPRGTVRIEQVAQGLEARLEACFLTERG